MKTKVLIIFLLIIQGLAPLFAQITPTVDTIPVPAIDSSELIDLSEPDLVNFDSLIVGRDSVFNDNKITTFQTRKVAYSKDSLDSEVESFGNDSMWYDIKNTEVHLWGDAYVKYKTITLTADYIVYNWTSNIVTAEGTTDSLGQSTGLPNFKDGEEAFDASKLKYNFKTSKGIIYDAVSQYNDIYVRSGKGKFISKGAEPHQDDDHIYSCDAIFTTCNHPHPHFGFRSRKQKVIPNKVVVVGPSNVELGGVPTPLWLPFGFFPLKQGQRTGLIFPQDYEYSEQWGFGLKNIGWYFPMNDYIDLILTGDIYTRGTWGLHANSRYKKRYKYNGSLRVDFADQRTEAANSTRILKNRSLRIAWTHNQDKTAHPTNTFRGGLNLQTNNYQSNVENDAESVFNNNISSNINFSKTFPGKPFSLTAGFNHSQNSQSRIVTVNFPDFKFNMQRIKPFKGMRKPGKQEQWYEKITLTYNADAINKFTATDTTLFTQQTLNDAKFGVRHTANTDINFKVLKYFTLTPSAKYTEVWNFKLLEKQFDPTAVVDTIWNEEEGTFTLDTTAYGTVSDDFKYGFKPLRLFNTSIGMNTAVYGTLLFEKGWLRGLRHVAKPTISMSYTPDYTTDAWGYFKEVQTDSRFDDEFDRYSIFQNGAFSDQPSDRGKSMSLNYSLINTFEGKYFSKKDSSVHKFKFLDNINMRGSYNFAADSFKWNTIAMTGSTRLFKNLSSLQLGATFDPLDYENGVRVDKTVWSQRKKLFGFVNATARLSTRFTVKQLADFFSGKKNKAEGEKPKPAGQPVAGQESLLDMLGNFSFNHQINTSLNRIYNDGVPKDTFQISTHNLSMNGRIQLTDKWRITFQQISYDFKAKRLVYPSLAFYRDLHCWELSMSWTPDRNVYTFSLKVKPGSMDFLKVPYGRNRADGGGFGGF